MCLLFKVSFTKLYWFFWTCLWASPLWGAVVALGPHLSSSSEEACCSSSLFSSGSSSSFTPGASEAQLQGLSQQWVKKTSDVCARTLGPAQPWPWSSEAQLQGLSQQWVKKTSDVCARTLGPAQPWPWSSETQLHGPSQQWVRKTSDVRARTLGRCPALTLAQHPQSHSQLCFLGTCQARTCNYFDESCLSSQGRACVSLLRLGCHQSLVMGLEPRREGVITLWEICLKYGACVETGIVFLWGTLL